MGIQQLVRVPMNTVREILKLNRLEAEKGITGKGSWHHQFKDSAWVFVGGLPKAMTEGDVLCFFSQVGEIEKLDMRRDRETGKFLGFCFIKYEDQRSTILAVDNFTGVSFAGTTIRVDHKFYTPPKKRKQRDEDDSSEEEKQDLLVEEKKALQDVRWDIKHIARKPLLLNLPRRKRRGDLRMRKTEKKVAEKSEVTSHPQIVTKSKGKRFHLVEPPLNTLAIWVCDERKGLMSFLVLIKKNLVKCRVDRNKLKSLACRFLPCSSAPSETFSHCFDAQTKPIERRKLQYALLCGLQWQPFATSPTNPVPH